MQISQVQQLLLSPPPLKRPMPFEQPQPPFLPSFPQPLPKMARRTMIQIRLQPQPLPFWGLAQPQSLEQLQFVAVKSLMFLDSLYWIMLYSMRRGSFLFLSAKN
jgi:hypothetical protein